MSDRRPLLSVRDLRVTYVAEGGRRVHANRGVSFEVGDDEVLGLIGESGSGKTTAGKAVLRLLPGGTEVTGEVRYAGQDVLAMDATALRSVRWSDIAMVPQNALNALDPIMRVGAQIIEPLRARGASKQASRQRAGELLAAVGLDEAHLQAYPHELSGGMRQRVCIAMALALRPALVIADEPTTALDVLVERDVLALVDAVRQDTGLSLLYITHDLGVAAALCDRIVVMYDGRVVEQGPTRQVLDRPAHPYTMGLISSYPRPDSEHAASIPGAPPGPGDELPGCSFAPRCPFATGECPATAPELVTVGRAQESRCLYAHDAEAMRQATRDRVLLA